VYRSYRRLARRSPPAPVPPASAAAGKPRWLGICASWLQLLATAAASAVESKLMIVDCMRMPRLAIARTPVVGYECNKYSSTYTYPDDVAACQKTCSALSCAGIGWYAAANVCAICLDASKGNSSSGYVAFPRTSIGAASAARCSVCDKNWHTNGSACTSCPSKSTSKAGSTKLSDCRSTCAANQYLSGSKCVACPSGSTSYAVISYSIADCKCRASTFMNSGACLRAEPHPTCGPPRSSRRAPGTVARGEQQSLDTVASRAPPPPPFSAWPLARTGVPRQSARESSGTLRTSSATSAPTQEKAAQTATAPSTSARRSAVALRRCARPSTRTRSRRGASEKAANERRRRLQEQQQRAGGAMDPLNTPSTSKLPCQRGRTRPAMTTVIAKPSMKVRTLCLKRSPQQHRQSTWMG